MSNDIKVVFSSDWHIGLKTDEIDRTEEIIGVGFQVVKHCKKLKDEGYKRVILVLGGDIFNTNYPSDDDVIAFIRVLNLIRKYEIETYVMVGNHDATNRLDKTSCLEFVRKIKSAYPTITLIDDIKFMEVGENDIGKIYFTFLPHITRSLIQKRVNDGKYKGEVNTRDYIERKAKRIVKKLGKQEVTHYAFSHLNVIGAHPGSEENLLKKSEVYLPSAFTTDTPLFYWKPTIIQGHIHSQSVIDNIHIIGSPIYCSFGETGPKYFAEISINSCLGVKDEIELIETNCKEFIQLELDMVGCTDEFFKIPEVKNFMETIANSKDPIVKIDITINPENNTYDWVEIRKHLMSINGYVKPIVPRVVVKRQVRSVDQKIDLPIKDKIKVYLKRNLIKDKVRAKRIYKRAQKYIEADSGIHKTK